MPNDIKTISEHLSELKNLAIKLFGSWFVSCVALSFFTQNLIDIFTRPLGDIALTLNFFSPTDSLFFVLKIVSVSGLVVSSPLLVWFVWGYLSKALEARERQFLFSYFGSALVLTLAALAYSYLYLIPTSLKFLTDFTPKNTGVILSANEYSNFLLSMFLAITLVFQTPIMVMSLVKTGLVKIETFKAKRKEIYFGIVIVTALFGSPDVFSWFITTLPVFMLFESSLILASYSFTKNNK